MPQCVEMSDMKCSPSADDAVRSMRDLDLILINLKSENSEAIKFENSRLATSLYIRKCYSPHTPSSIRFLTLCILETHKWVLCQTVKTQMKCRIIQHNAAFQEGLQFARIKTTFRDINPSLFR